jgi:hypothetical protein
MFSSNGATVFVCRYREQMMLLWLTTGEVESVDVESCCWSGEGDFGEWYENVDEPICADDTYVRIRWWLVSEREVGFSDSDDVPRT